MDYCKIYNALIERARKRKLDCYVEKHHIVPRCMNGSDDAKNLVELLPEEHYIAHLLLVKIYPNQIGLIYAGYMMCRRSNKEYGWLKRKLSEVPHFNLGRKHSEQSKNKIKSAKIGLLQSEETKAKRSNALKGRKKSAETIEKIRAAAKKRKISPETRAKIALAKIGQKHSVETRAKMSEWQIGRILPESTKQKISATLRSK